MSDDIKHFREAVAKFDELKLELEDLKEGLETNFNNYKNVSDISSDIADKNQSVLENINTLQINAVDAVESAFNKVTDLKENMSKYYSAEYSKTKKDLDALLSSIENELSTLKSAIETTIQDAVRNVNIDTSDLSKVINEKIAKYDLSKLDHFIKNSNLNIDKAIGSMAHSMTQVERIDSLLKGSIKSLYQTADHITNTTENLNDAVETINTANKSLSMAMTLAMLFVGIVIGAGVMTYLKIDATSNFYFSQYEQKQVKLEADQKEITARLGTLSAFEKWIISNNYKFNFGKLDDSNQNYISIDKSTHSKCKGWQGYTGDKLQDHAYIATSKNLVICFD